MPLRKGARHGGSFHHPEESTIRDNSTNVNTTLNCLENDNSISCDAQEAVVMPSPFMAEALEAFSRKSSTAARQLPSVAVLQPQPTPRLFGLASPCNAASAAARMTHMTLDDVIG